MPSVSDFARVFADGFPPFMIGKGARRQALPSPSRPAAVRGSTK
jgi:hypothetical protein